MTVPSRYDAFWIPEPEEYDNDAALVRGFEWLDTAPYPGERVIALYAKSMLGNRRILQGVAKRYHVASLRSPGISHMKAGPVLALWPTPPTLEMAEQIAFNGALCVIAGRNDIAWWVAKTGAVNLSDPDAEPGALAALPQPIVEVLESILFFGGHNGFLGAGEKEDVVSSLRSMLSDGHQPEPQDIEDYARASGKTDVDGARRLRELYETILAGKGLRDYRGRSI